jgi:hypothetical protein
MATPLGKRIGAVKSGITVATPIAAPWLVLDAYGRGSSRNMLFVRSVYASLQG